METGRVIHRRYLLQRLLKQEQDCALYQGFDQVLQRAVMVKVPNAEHIPAYRAAVRATSQFAHPHIVGIYDLIVESEHVYIVQEYVDGDTFEVLLQKALTPYQVVEMGVQICQALLYASSPSRKICHGNLTPEAVVRDQRGYVRITNFALPTDMQYFTAWSSLGSEGLVISDAGLPSGQMTDGRRADDARSVGLLLYQLLTPHPASANKVEPPADKRLRFMRTSPAELCELVARLLVRQHPQNIATVEALHSELKKLAAALEPPMPAVAATPRGTSSDAQVAVPQLSPSIPSGQGRAASRPLQEPFRMPSSPLSAPAAVAEMHSQSPVIEPVS
ncbi:MAG: protein kinase, partial [Ktedonobacteraceae bacterium]|nr:protein kinase [Ktedonobacteraceae bacterium]